MAKIKKPSRTNRVEADGGTEILENPAAIQESFFRTEDFIKTNKTLVFGIGGLIALAIAGVFIYKMYMNNQNKEAQLEMYQAVYYFEADSLQKALNGDGNSYGFLEIVDRYGRSDAGNLANFYIGVSYLKLGQFQEAIDYLNDFSSKDLLVQARAYALIGDANMELNNFSDAAKNYEKAADHRSNKYFSPQYLMKAALAYERLDNNSKAIQIYDRIINDFHDADEVQDARKHKARLEGLAAK
ncbi:MAG: tetratricopeptide repeat protein [Bacteroidota bacterium]|nr:tetratricopeptide repeat protein [Bacteroidota bacterium]